ncbi:SulP family inorganic anion transporter [Microbacteriaceae bacterium 4G12]
MKAIFTNRFEGYSFRNFQKDLLAGIIVGVIAIPLGMSFAIASGVKPEYGIYTTCIAGTLISLLGGSKYQIGGPTGAFIPILLGIILSYGYENLLIAGLLAGILLCLMGIFKLGDLIKFIPRPVTIGFTSGIAVTIFTGQIGSFLGLVGMKKHEAFLANLNEIFIHINTVNMYSILIAGICLVVILLTPRILPKVPGPLVGLVVSTVIAGIFFSHQVPTIGTAYGSIPSTLPRFHFPHITWDLIQKLIGPAFVIAMLGGIESLLSAVVADGMTNSKHNSNRELIGQGIANIITPLFGGIPATGALARTATNIKSGATSPMSGIIHGVFVLITLLLLAPYASGVPLASMAPILMVVAWNMSERKHFAHILKMKSGDSLVLLVTFLLTVFTSLTTAVEVGLVLAVILFAKQMSGMITITKVLPDHKNNQEKVRSHVVNETHNCPQVTIYTIEGPLFFGAAQTFEQNIMDTIHYAPKVLILRMSKVPFIDATGEAYLRNIVKHFTSHGGIVLISEIKSQVKETLKQNGLYHEIGEANFFEHTGDAISFSISQLDRNICLACNNFAFRECSHLSQPFQKERVQTKLGKEVSVK